MNSYQKSSLSSYKLIANVADNNENVVSTIPYFDNGIKRFKIVISDIDDLSALQNQDLTGITVDKNDYLGQACDFLLEVAGAVHSYAVEMNDKALQSLVDYKPSKIAKLDQHDVVDACVAVLAQARKLSEKDLADAGLTADELAQFEAVVTYLKENVGARREAGIDQAGITRRIADLFRQAHSIKKNTLDRLAPQFQRKAPEFYEKYKAASNIIYKQAAPKPVTTTEEK